MSIRACSVVALNLLLSLSATERVLAQATRVDGIDIPRGALASDSTLAPVAPRLAAEVLSRYREPDDQRRLNTLFRLQLAAGRDGDATTSLRLLRELRTRGAAMPSPESTLPYEIYATALATQRTAGITFDSAFRSAFRARLQQTSDPTAAHEARWVFGTSLGRLEADLGQSRALASQRSDSSALSLSDVVDLLGKHLAVEVYRRLAPLVPAAFGEDDQRRYIIDRDVRVRTPDGATVCALLVRPRAASTRLPALLEFTIYADTTNNLIEARRSASRGYVGVVALTRGKRCSPDQPVPIEHDGADAAAVIDWISRQEWSDGRVGMYGGSYDGFTQWAAAKRRPPALKAIMPSVTFAPGVDFPMEGNVFMTYAFPWPLYTTNVKELDSATYFDEARWTSMTRAWYVKGRAYRDLESVADTPNPVFRRWLTHPGYDAYWRSLTPTPDEYARISIPVLTTTGYFDSGQIGALHYFRQHVRHRPDVEHYLVIGPYDHRTAQRGTVSPLGRVEATLRGYALDSTARFDIDALRYQWFDHVFRGAPKPALLRDRVNYEVMGANAWRHAPSIDAVGNDSLSFYLTADGADRSFRLGRRPSVATTVSHRVDLSDRADADSAERGMIVDQALDSWAVVDTVLRIGNAIRWTSDPLPAAVEVSGLFSGRLEFITNKRDFDVSVTLYERTTAGQYMHLAYYWTRASFAADRSRRTLLTPGRRERLAFQSGRFTSRRVQAGSRLVVVLGILKQPWEQINYGTGKDVSDETIADARDPLEVRWLGESYVRLPTRR